MRSIDGRPEEFTTVVGVEQRALARLAYLLCGDPSVAEDVVAEAVARVWVRWSAGSVDDLGAYLRRAVANEAHERRRRRFVELREANHRRRPAMGGAVDEAVTAHMDVVHALQKLPMAQRVVVVLRYFEDRSEADIARVLGVPEGTVKSRAARAVTTLRALLGGGDDV